MSDTTDNTRGPLKQLMNLRPGEATPVLWSAAYAFLLLCSYYILRPLRDELSANDREYLQTLWVAVFFVMLAVAPVYMWLVGRFSRRRLIPFAYRFFIVNLLVFYLLLQLIPESRHLWIERAFYVWTSVFNLFVVSIMWSFMSDIFRNEQSKRLFGLIAVGGSAGALLGSRITAVLIDPPEALSFLAVDWLTLLLIAAVGLELACQCVGGLNRMSARRAQQATEPASDQARSVDGRGDGSPRVSDADRLIAGTLWEGLVAVVRSPYLLGICFLVLLMNMPSTYLYFMQADIVRAAFDDRDIRRAFMADVDFYTSLGVLFIQFFVTGQMMSRLGVGITLITLPVICIAAFWALAISPTLWAVVAAQVTLRSTRFAFAKPSREVLFTVVTRQERYKTKAFIDTVVYRGSDVANSYLYEVLLVVLLTVSAVALTIIPFAGIWIVLALYLGREQDRRAATSSRSDADP